MVHNFPDRFKAEGLPVIGTVEVEDEACSVRRGGIDISHTKSQSAAAPLEHRGGLARNGYLVELEIQAGIRIVLVQRVDVPVVVPASVNYDAGPNAFPFMGLQDRVVEIQDLGLLEFPVCGDLGDKQFVFVEDVARRGFQSRFCGRLR